MQTFLPYASYTKSASVLDYQRLGKQRVESKQILQAILDVDKHGDEGNTGQAFTNHPIYAQWQNYPEALLSYTWSICREWRDRGFRDGVMNWLFAVAELRDIRMMSQATLERRSLLPWWHGKKRVHVLHRANLLVKNPMWYGARPEELGYKRWVIPEQWRTGFGYSWPLAEEGQWKDIRRDKR